MKRIQSNLGLALIGLGIATVGAISVSQLVRNQAEAVQVNSEEWLVVNVADGDTLTVGQQGQEQRIRLCGIDAPELSQPLGEQSKAQLQQLMAEASDRVLVTPVEIDQYGRTVAEVDTIGTGKFVQHEMLAAGMAYVYDRYVDGCPNPNLMREAQAIAQQQKIGVWSGNYERPWDYRRSQ